MDGDVIAIGGYGKLSCASEHEDSLELTSLVEGREAESHQRRQSYGYSSSYWAGHKLGYGCGSGHSCECGYQHAFAWGPTDALQAVEMFDSKRGAWRSLPPMQERRYAGSAMYVPAMSPSLCSERYEQEA